MTLVTRNSSGDEIANVNFLYDDIVHALQRRCTKFSEITQCDGIYAVQGHSRSPILIPIESSYDFLLVINILTYLLSYTVSIQIMANYWSNFSSESGVPHFNALAGGDPCQYRHK